MPKGENVMKISKESISVSELRITVKNEVQKAEVKVSSLGDMKPETVKKDVEDTAFQYLEISKKNLEDENIGNVEVEFKVEKTWIVDNNISEDSIVLNRYNGKWGELDTEKTNTIGTHVTYEAVTPGFSYFAITGEKIVEEVPELNVTEDKGMEDITALPILQEVEKPEIEEKKSVGLALILVPSLFLLVVYFIFFRKKKGKGEKVFKNY
tara:strand:- start:1248 stop:1877 length:630 start_codon:yes stop_codon:yes gene_type:complete